MASRNYRWMVRTALYRWFERHRWAGDGILAVLFEVALLINSVSYFQRHEVASAVLALSGVPLSVRRSRPEVAVLASCGLLLLNLWFIDTPTVAVLLAPLMVHAAVAHARRRAWGRLALVMGLIGSVSAPLRWGYLGADNSVLAMGFGFCAISVVAAFVAGERQRDRRDHQSEQLRALEERAALLAAERDQRASIATATERTRIARELHDIVAHGLSVVIVQADGAAAAVAAHPELAPSVLRTIAETSREALAEMRRLVAVLRTDPAGTSSDGYAPAQVIADLPALVDQVQQAGAQVRLTVTGAAHPGPAGLELTAYRLVQEALTNVLKHAGPGAQARVTLTYSLDVLHVSVIDDGRGTALDAAYLAGPGHGLLGMRERVWLQGGRVTAGPRPGGGFGVEAVLPLPHEIGSTRSRR